MNPLLGASGVRTLTGFLLFSFLINADARSWAQDGTTPPLIGSWEISGNARVERDTILSWVSLRPGLPWSMESYSADLERIRECYSSEGFFQARVESDTLVWSPDSLRVDLRVVLQEGPRATLAQLRFQGAMALGEAELERESGLPAGTAFSVRTVEEGLRNVLNAYELKGFPLARARIIDIALDEGPEGVSVTVTVELTEGRRALVTEVRISGNEVTRDEVILREIRLGAGKPFDPGLPGEVRRKLQRLDIFSSVSEPQFTLLETGDLGLSITVREGNTNRFDGAVGYIPATSAGRAGYVTGLLDLAFRNLFGTGRRLDARWRRIDQLSQDLALRYREPWLFALPLSVAGGFTQRKQDSSYVQRSVDVSAELMLTDELSFGLTVTTGSVVPGQLAAPTVAGSRSTGFALFILYDSRDRSVAPTAGALYQTSYERGSKRVDAGSLQAAPASETKERITADIEAYVMIARPHMVALAAHGREIRTPLLDVSDLFRLGGARTLRGYAEDQFLGSRVVWTTAEYRLLAGSRSFLYAFCDWAYVATVTPQESSLPASEVRPYGYGAGFLVDTALGSVNVSIAAGKDDTFSTAKFHLRLVNEF